MVRDNDLRCFVNSYDEFEARVEHLYKKCIDGETEASVSRDDVLNFKKIARNVENVLRFIKSISPFYGRDAEIRIYTPGYSLDSNDKYMVAHFKPKETFSLDFVISLDRDIKRLGNLLVILKHLVNSTFGLSHVEASVLVKNLALRPSLDLYKNENLSEVLKLVEKLNFIFKNIPKYSIEKLDDVARLSIYEIKRINFLVFDK